MKIYVISAGSVCSAAASTNRMLSLAKGLAEAGHAVIIYCLAPVGSLNREKISGEIDGIPYTHLGRKTSCCASSLPVKVLHFINSTLAGLRVIKEKERPDAILLLSVRFLHLITYLYTARKLSVPVFHERNEYPHRDLRTFLDRVCLKLYLRYIIPRFTGLALMTRALVKYFSENCLRCPPVLHLPMTVELSRFLAVAPSPITGRYIAHCGSSFGDKDGVPILVESFARISPEFPKVKLVLIGSDADQNTMECLQQQIQKCGIQERIILTGLVERERMPAWLCNAELLTLARPANLQAAGGFPTKLGEYLSSARPVVVTKVGEIPDYLQDGVNAWLAEPGSVDSFANKLHEVLSLDATNRNAVALKGRTVAQTVFNYSVQGQKFSQFIEEQVMLYRAKQI